MALDRPLTHKGNAIFDSPGIGRRADRAEPRYGGEDERAVATDLFAHLDRDRRGMGHCLLSDPTMGPGRLLDRIADRLHRRVGLGPSPEPVANGAGKIVMDCRSTGTGSWTM